MSKKHRRLKELSNDICDAIKENLQENLYKNWYSNYSPISYKRTWDLYDSITGIVTSNGRCNYTIQVFFDPEKIQAVKNDANWNSHMGFNQSAFIQGLVSSIESGMKGSYKNPRLGDAAHMIKFTQEWANQYARQLLKNF